jgi:hypothetical protein
MSSVRYLMTKDSVHLNFNGTHVTLPSHDPKYGEVLRLIKEQKLNEIEAVMQRRAQAPEDYVEGSGLKLLNGQLVDVDGNALPEVLNRRMQDLKNEGFSISPLIAFWNNLKENPSLRSREQLYKFLEQNGHPLTDDGHFIAYRGIRNDFKDVHSGTFDNSPGSVCEMPRRDVDDDPTVTCSRGLHVAAYEYAKGFGAVTVEVKVNPRDVVAVPTDYNGQKMRVCRFEVLQVCQNERTNEVVYNNYAGDYWDAYDPAEEVYSEHEVEQVLDIAEDLMQRFPDRYADRTVLAARIEEDVYDLGLTVADVLTILNDNLD